MGRVLVFLAGAGFGAAAARWLLPDRVASGTVRSFEWRGRRQAGDAGETLAKTQSLLREIRSLVLHVDIPDEVLVAKLNAKVARQARHPELIRVQVSGGKVVLRGSATAQEAHDLVESISLIRGVKSVEDRFEAAPEEAEADARIFSGEGRDKVNPAPRVHAPGRPIPAGYPPAVSIMMGVAGLALASYGYRNRGAAGAALVAAGAAIFGAGAAGFWGTGHQRRPFYPNGDRAPAFLPGSQGAPGSRGSLPNAVP